MHISPHPLDYDWRFEEPTIEGLCGMIADSGRVLALGAPSVAQRLERLGHDVTLVDRQPEGGVSSHVMADIDLLVEPMPGFDVAIVDPPWYPRNLLHWASYAASCVGAGGTVLASAWPASTRPWAEDELNAIIARISDWATVHQVAFEPSYEMPRFERLAIEVAGLGPLSASPRRGILLKISVKRQPQRLAP